MATIQLSDTQSVILSAACAREGGLVLPITTTLKGGAVDMVLTSMIKKGLIEAIPAEAGAPVWREAEDGTPLTLVATAAAYMALGIAADTAPEEEPAADMADEAESPPTDAHVAKPARKPREGTKQEALVAKAVEAVLQDPAVKARWLDLGGRAPTEKNPQRTGLEKQLSDYTPKNTADYFIHKALGGFLRRELDFYIKNEVMHLDDVENETVPRVEQYLSKIKVIRKIAGKIIAFLAQLEDFQKKLWLKKWKGGL
jgi:hypothetical protein